MRRKFLVALILILPLLVFGQGNGAETASYWDVFISSFKSFANYTWNEITFQVTPWYVNYFWWLVVLSLVVWLLEIIFPWRKNQAIIRKDFWLDAFYMFFNFYIFKLVIFMAVTGIANKAIGDITGGDLQRFALFNMHEFSWWIQLVIFFNFLWRFHKVHHSVEQMGFAAHLRFHWMENVFYSPMKYLMIVLIGGFNLEMIFVAYYIAIAIGHLNHANIGLSYGPLKYILNNPKMHIWHHAKELPKDRQLGANFGISLSIWDYIFRTNYIPEDGRDIELGFDDMDKFPKTFWGQLFYGFRKKGDRL